MHLKLQRPTDALNDCHRVILSASLSAFAIHLKDKVVLLDPPVGGCGAINFFELAWNDIDYSQTGGFGGQHQSHGVSHAAFHSDIKLACCSGLLWWDLLLRRFLHLRRLLRLRRILRLRRLLHLRRLLRLHRLRLGLFESQRLGAGQLEALPRHFRLVGRLRDEEHRQHQRLLVDSVGYELLLRPGRRRARHGRRARVRLLLLEGRQSQHGQPPLEAPSSLLMRREVSGSGSARR
mmetsp:Transcript_120935/g.387174  ORF Transcript_120935/g.387174 Transcript_120935/m.387174 type:complete len:235 (-) Transcript_120935:386-1090(-)